jgi:hypothetical protein
MTASIRATAIRKKANVANIVGHPATLLRSCALSLGRQSYATPRLGGMILS